ncbi:biogenesis of lysosome-related organelles complex 1 subunit 4 [Bombina bombina]|uniref:biogenesis of lysosome-related organelles complex 1 subunit 4 n=1 Tax=Bombina bombina TaxID=8345 RepID=UPI00235A50D4|nr:biogenesis of lysosome-related organelles complex 1 subunit 4 [Bombina bombina]
MEFGAGQLDPLDEEQGVSEQGSPGDSGHVSQSHSVCSGASAGLLTEDDADWAASSATLQPSDSLIKTSAVNFSSYVLVGESSTETETLEKSLEDLLIRVDEFVGMLDMTRNDTAQVINEKVPQIYTKAAEMKKLYQKIDSLEAFVKMVGNNVSLMEEQVARAEANLGTFPNPFKNFLRNSVAPLFSPNKSTSARQQPLQYEPPTVFKTEEYFHSSS